MPIYNGIFETISLHLPVAIIADTVLGMDGGILECDKIQEIQVLGDAETCLKPHPQWPPSSVLNFCTSYSILIFKCIPLMIDADVNACLIGHKQAIVLSIKFNLNHV